MQAGGDAVGTDDAVGTWKAYIASRPCANAIPECAAGAPTRRRRCPRSRRVRI